MANITGYQPLLGLMLLLVCSTFVLCRSSFINKDFNNQGLVELRQYFDNQLESFRTDVHRSFQQRFQRVRRDVSTDLIGDLAVEQPLLIDNITVVEHFDINQQAYIIVGRQLGSGVCLDSNVTIHRFDSVYAPTDHFQESCVKDIAAFLVGGDMLIAVANYFDGFSYDILSRIYRFDPATEKVSLAQQILTHGAADFHFFEFQGDGYLALANMRREGYEKYKSFLQVFVYNGAHFDFIVSAQTYGATSIAVLEIEWELYIAVAQYTDNEGNIDIGSVVYKFDVDTDALHQVQTLDTSAPEDIVAFFMNGNHYLAVANSKDSLSANTDSVIYWWTGIQFVEYQRIAADGANQWELVELPNQEILLILSTAQGPVVYEFNLEAEWVPAEEQFDGIPSVHVGPYWTTESMDLGGSLYVVTVSSRSLAVDYVGGTTNVFRVLPSVAPPYVKPVDDIPACLRSLESNIDSLFSSLDDLNGKLEGALKLDGDQKVISKVVFKGRVTVENTLNVTNLTILDEYSFNMEPVIIEDGAKIGERLSELLPEKDDVVTISGDEIISSPLRFTQTVNADNSTVTNTNTNNGRINGIHILNLNDSLVKLTGDQTIDGNPTLTEDVSLGRSHIDVHGKVNGIDIPENVMTIEGSQTAWGHLTFTNATTFTGDVTVDGLINGLNLSTDVVTTHLDHTVSGTKIVDRDLVVVQNTNVADGKTVDNVDLSEFETQTISLTRGGTMSGVITFQGQAKIDGQLLTDIVDGINVTELERDVVWKDTAQTIYDDKLFHSNLTALSHLAVGGNINGLPFSDFVLRDTPGAPINTQVRFAKTVSVVGNLDVNGKLNGLDIPEDIVTIDGSQNITGTVNFTKTISVLGDISMKENATMESVDISELPSDTVSVSDTNVQIVDGVKRFRENVDVDGNITVDQLINRVNLTLLEQPILSLTKPQVIDLPVEVRGQLVIKGDLQLENDTIDGYQLSWDLVSLHNVSNIEGYKIFKDFATINGDLQLDPGTTISGVDLRELNRTVIKLNAVQTINGEVLIGDGVAIHGNLDIDGRVNGLDISEDLITLGGNQTITRDIAFESIDVQGNIETSRLNVTKINSVDINELYSSAVMAHGPGDDVNSPVNFNLLEVNNELLVNGAVDGVDVADFALNVVTLSGDQTVDGVLEFTGDVRFSENITVHGNVSGIDFNTFVSSVVLKDTDAPIYGEKNFASNVSVAADVTIDDLINGIDLELLNQTYLSRTLDQTLSGHKVFTNVTVDNIHLDQGVHVNGLIPSIDLVLINIGGDFINGTLWFSNFLEVDGDLNVGETLNDVDLLEFYNSVVWLQGLEQTITGHWTLHGGMHIIGNITMEELMEVNGVDVSELTDLSNFTRSPIIKLPTVIMEPVTIKGDVEHPGLLDGIDFSFIFEDAIMIGPNQTIWGDKTFTTNLTAGRLEAEIDVVPDVISGTANLTYLLQNAVLKSTDQEVHGPVTFTEDVVIQEHLIVDGLIEGIDLSEEAVLNYTDQALTGDNVFENGFRVEGNITAGLIDTVDLPLLASIVFLVDDFQIVQGKWQFLNNVTVYGDITVAGTVNGIDLNETLVTLTGDHDILESKTIANAVIVQGHLFAGLVNGVNLTEFELDVVLRDGNFNIVGDKVFAGEVTFLTNLTVLGLINGIDIQQMYWDHWVTVDRLQWQLSELNDTLGSMCMSIASLQGAVLKQAVMLSYWEAEYQINNSPATSRYDSLRIEGGLLLAFGESNMAQVDDCIQTTLYLCMDTDISCYELEDESLPAASNVELFNYEGEVFVVLALSQQSSSCMSSSGTDDEVQILKMGNASYDERLPAEHPRDTSMFVIDGSLFLAVANEYDVTTGDKNIPSSVFEYNPSSATFTKLQDIATMGSTAVAYLEHNDRSWLAFTCTPGTTYSLIMAWNASSHQFVLEASIQTDYASDVLGLEIDNAPMMLFANEKRFIGYGTVDLNQPISVYEYSFRLGWTLKQEVDAVGVVQLTMFKIDEIIYLVAVSNLESIDIYKWSGASKFEIYKSLPMTGVVSVHPFIQWGNLHMAVATPVFGSMIVMESWAFMKAIIKGQNEYTSLELS